MIARIARITNGWVRVPLWIVAFIILFVSEIALGLWNGRAFRFEFWDFHWAIFWIGAEGHLVGTAIIKETA
jgi:hypothetical protein